jgi:hypothetical protein
MEIQRIFSSGRGHASLFPSNRMAKGLWHTLQGELQFRAEAAASQGKQQARRSQDNSENIAGSLSLKPS